ncbi:MAG: hypothetical protein IPK83_20755 [Planctomycetes bacterium]|nr:hypothetical protein [Planctomycetota bacterium]
MTRRRGPIKIGRWRYTNGWNSCCERRRRADWWCKKCRSRAMGGGLCVVKGERRLFVDSLADSQTRYERTLEALAGIAEFPAASLPAVVRDDMEREGRRKARDVHD